LNEATDADEEEYRSLVQQLADIHQQSEILILMISEIQTETTQEYQQHQPQLQQSKPQNQQQKQPMKNKEKDDQSASHIRGKVAEEYPGPPPEDEGLQSPARGEEANPFPG